MRIILQKLNFRSIWFTFFFISFIFPLAYIWFASVEVDVRFTITISLFPVSAAESDALSGISKERQSTSSRRQSQAAAYGEMGCGGVVNLPDSFK